MLMSTFNHDALLVITKQHQSINPVDGTDVDYLLINKGDLVTVYGPDHEVLCRMIVTESKSDGLMQIISGIKDWNDDANELNNNDSYHE